MVQLVELPTADETFDNIVAFWNPAEPAQPGREINLSYRLYWGAQPPFQPSVATVLATRTGMGGVPGQRPSEPMRKFVIDFQGGTLARLPATAKVEAVVNASRGEIRDVVALKLKESELWRCHFDLNTKGSAPVICGASCGMPVAHSAKPGSTNGHHRPQQVERSKRLIR
jgi:glucans biosynthesis protein